MIAHVATLARWEWFKLRRRWMPWILLAVLLLISQLFLWGSFFNYRGQERSGGQVFFGDSATGRRPVTLSCNDLLAGRADIPPEVAPGTIEQMRQNCQLMAAQQQEQLREMRASFTLPGSIPRTLSVANGIGLILIAILTASMVGAEYGWGTVRSALVRGTGRWQYLAAKLALAALVAAAALVVVLGVTVVSSLAAQGLAGGETNAEVSGEWTNAAIALGKGWFALLPYVALAGFVAVFTTSSSAGMAVALGYYFGEQIVVLILINLFDWFQTVADYILGRNIAAWMLSTQAGNVSGVSSGPGIRVGEYPSEMHAFLVLAAYMLVLGGVAFWLFLRRDIAASGGG
ncbi:MAG: ABC transporter permease subunit [Chloroflexi bacterium]|nr:ABC transporter permease subunit [Chloroflexota bacterium]